MSLLADFSAAAQRLRRNRKTFPHIY